MVKKEKIILLFLILSCFLLFYLILFSESKIVVYNLNNEDNNKDNISKKEIENNQNNSKKIILEEYKINIKNIFFEYSSLLEQKETLELKEIENIKNKILELTVPEEFKKLHLNFIFALEKMEIFLTNGSEDEKEKSFNLISDIKFEYPWLN